MFKINKINGFVILALIILGGLVFYFLWQNYQKSAVEEEQAKQKILDKQWQFSITKDIASTLRQFNGLEFYSPNSDYLLWKKDGYLVYLPTNDSIFVIYCGLSADIINGDTKKIFNSTPLGSISKEIKAIFDDQEYLLDSVNSTELGDYYFMQGYYKDKTQCILNLSGDISTCGPNNQDYSVSLDIKCGTDLNQSFAQQTPYVDLLIFLNAVKDKAVAITNVIEEGNFLRIDETSGIGGALFILKREMDNNYLLIEGPLQEDPQCSKMKEWNVPEEIYGSCYDVSQPFSADQ